VRAGVFLYIRYMIYTILAIPFGAAFIYNYTASIIAKKCFRAPTEEEAENFGLTKEQAEETKLFEVEKAGRYLAVMAVSYYPAYPILMAQKWLTK